jgi:hypothetical protein
MVAMVATVAKEELALAETVSADGPKAADYT